MRLRFLAAAGPDEAVERLASEIAATGGSCLSRILRAPRLSVWAPPQTPRLTSEDGGAAVIGLLFDRNRGARQQRLSTPLPSCTQFAEQYWGSYVLLANEGDGHLVLPDPSGGVSAYHRRIGSLDLYASDWPMFTTVDAGAVEPDLAFLREWLSYPFLRTKRTGVRGVCEILPGQAFRAGPAGQHESSAWCPWPHASRKHAIGDFETAAAHVREAILLAVPRLAQDADDVVVQLSGGLDSSIVAAALTAAGRSFRAVTFATLTPDGDERIHAREVARHCGIELTELMEEPAAVDFAHVAPPALRPLPTALLEPLHRALANHLVLTGADLVLDGSGGDNVFSYLASASPLLDAFRGNGAMTAFATAHDLAQRYGTTSWAITRAALRRSRRPVLAWPRDMTFLAPGVAATEASHPWFDAPTAALRGTCEQVQSIVGVRHFLPDPVPGSAAVLHPLLAQPIVEACLRIPSWLWVRGGRDRAVARAAFRGLLPNSVLARRSKGHLASMFVRGYWTGRPQLEALLLDGKLAQAGLLDRTAVCDYLRRETRPDDAGYIRLLDLASAETWLRSFDR